MQNVQPWNGVELLLQIVNADDRPGSLRVLRAKAAERDYVLNARAFTAVAYASRHSLLVGAIILGLHCWGKHQVDGIRALECGGHRLRVLGVSREDFGPARGERLEFRLFATDHANLFAFREERYPPRACLCCRWRL